MQKLVPSIWFEDNCEEAVNFYVDTFNGAPGSKKDSKVVHLEKYPENSNIPGGDKMVGKILTAIFELAGQRFMALDGGPGVFQKPGVVSFLIDCQNQEEVDYFWEKMSAVPEAEQCGWLTDKYGLAWQVIPKQLGELLSDPDKAKAKRAMDAMLKMKKIVIADLEKAAAE